MYGDARNSDRPPDNSVGMPPIPRRTALYVGADDTGARERALRRYTDAQQLAVIAVYSDADLARLVEDAQADNFDAVVIANRADIGPTAKDYSRLRDALSAVSVRLLVADETSL